MLSEQQEKAVKSMATQILVAAAANPGFIKGAFDSMLSSSFEKNLDFFNDDDIIGTLLPDMDEIKQDFYEQAYHKGYYGG